VVVVVAAGAVAVGAVVVAGAWAFFEPQAARNAQTSRSMQMRMNMAAP
jgi:hypothetical protein